MEISPSYLYNMINGYANFSKKHFDHFCETLKISDQEITIGALLLNVMPLKNKKIKKTDIESTQNTDENKPDELENWIRKTLGNSGHTLSDLALRMDIKYITLYQYIVGSTRITLKFIHDYCTNLHIHKDENIMIELAKNRTIARIKSHKKQKGYDRLYYWFYSELWIRSKSVQYFINSKTLNKSRASIIASVSSRRPINDEIFDAYCNFLNLSEEEITEGKKYQELRKVHLNNSSEKNEVDTTIPHSLLSLIVSGNFQENYSIGCLLNLDRTLKIIKQSVKLSEETIRQIVKEYFENPVLEPSE